jgi:hypothetical protein
VQVGWQARKTASKGEEDSIAVEGAKGLDGATCCRE